ncbi:MAG: MFS transporter [Dehalococcoidales bacterium]|nr:MFS transporter [Dehalococcoidales bacterium]
MSQRVFSGVMDIPRKDTAIFTTRVRTFFSGLVPLFVLAHFAHHLLTALPVPMLPFIRDDFGLSYTQAGLVVSAFSLAYGFGQLPAGWLADRIGARILITVGICGVALGGVLVGLSQTFVMMVVFLVLMGIAGGGYHPSASPLISASVKPENRGSALGFHLVGGSGSFFLAPLIAAGIASAWGWRGSFLGLAIPTAIFGVVFFVLLGRRIRAPVLQDDVVEEGSEQPALPNRWRRLVPFMALTVLTQAIVFSIVAFIPLFIVDQHGVSEGAAATYLAIIYSAGLWASPLGGYLSDRLGKVRVVLVVSLVSGPLIYLMNLASFGVGLGALLLVIGATMYVRMPASESFIIANTPERRRSTILGVYYFVGMEAGGILAPVMGYLIERFGFHTSFTAAGAAIVTVSVVCSFFLRGTRD